MSLRDEEINTLRKDTRGSHGRKVIYKPRRGASVETKAADPLIVAVLPPVL